MAQVLIIGASRGIGLETVRRALAAGHELRALARSAAAIPIDDPRLRKIAADALDSTAVASAVSGCDAVIEALGVAGGPSTVLQGTQLFSRATRVLIEAMHAARVRRLIAVTGFGAGDSRGHGGFLYGAVLFPLLLKRIYDDKDVQEQMVRSSGLDWTIVRPGLLTNGPATGAYRVLVEPAQWRFGSISRADVADFLVRQIGDRQYAAKTPVLIS